MILELAPKELMCVFYTPTIEVNCGQARDLEDTACKAYLLWVSEYPDYLPSLRIAGRPDEERALNRALFS